MSDQSRLLPVSDEEVNDILLHSGNPDPRDDPNWGNLTMHRVALALKEARGLVSETVELLKETFAYHHCVDRSCGGEDGCVCGAESLNLEIRKAVACGDVCSWDSELVVNCECNGGLPAKDSRYGDSASPTASAPPGSVGPPSGGKEPEREWLLIHMDEDKEPKRTEKYIGEEQGARQLAKGRISCGWSTEIQIYLVKKTVTYRAEPVEVEE